MRLLGDGACTDGSIESEPLKASARGGAQYKTRTFLSDRTACSYSHGGYSRIDTAPLLHP